MPKRVFWPATLIIMGLIFMATRMGLLPPQFWDFWPVLLIIVGLGGLITSDRDEWMSFSSTKNTRAAAAPRKAVAAKKASPKKKR